MGNPTRGRNVLGVNSDQSNSCLTGCWEQHDKKQITRTVLVLITHERTSVSSDSRCASLFSVDYPLILNQEHSSDNYLEFLGHDYFLCDIRKLAHGCATRSISLYIHQCARLCRHLKTDNVPFNCHIWNYFSNKTERAFEACRWSWIRKCIWNQEPKCPKVNHYFLNQWKKVVVRSCYLLYVFQSLYSTWEITWQDVIKSH